MCILGLVSFQSEKKIRQETMKECKYPTSEPLLGYPKSRRIFFNIIDFLELSDELRVLNLIQSFYSRNTDINK